MLRIVSKFFWFGWLFVLIIMRFSVVFDLRFVYVSSVFMNFVWLIVCDFGLNMSCIVVFLFDLLCIVLSRLSIVFFVLSCLGVSVFLLSLSFGLVSFLIFLSIFWFDVFGGSLVMMSCYWLCVRFLIFYFVCIFRLLCFVLYVVEILVLFEMIWLLLGKFGLGIRFISFVCVSFGLWISVIVVVVILCRLCDGILVVRLIVMFDVLFSSMNGMWFGSVFGFLNELL